MDENCPFSENKKQLVKTLIFAMWNYHMVNVKRADGPIVISELLQLPNR